MPYKPIEDYGIIGDLKTVALVATDGSIDFLCYPDFDSPSVFAAMLDAKKGGCFRISPVLEDARKSQLYVPDTNVLITRFMSDEGILEITDFMPIAESAQQPSRIVRMVRSVWGDVPVRMQCQPAFNYGREGFQAQVDGDGKVVVLAGSSEEAHEMCLHGSEKMAQESDSDNVSAHFTLATGEEAFFVLSCGTEKDFDFTLAQLKALHAQTISYWQVWVGKIKYRGRWQNTIHRSALVLKLLTSRQHGSIVAAPTFSLPEALGAKLNWDYRYCWIRDAAFTVYAFLQLGLKDEAVAFNDWINHLYGHPARNTGDGKLQLMYRINGETDIDEHTLDHFEGYKNSAPVRIGNAAFEQFQLDLYGQLMECIFLANTHITKISYDAWRNVLEFMEYVCDNWRKPDSGIWEFRHEKREFLHSRLMCWVALDRAIRLAEKESLPAPLEHWGNIRSEIYEDIFENFWDEEQQAFVQHKDTKALDAAALLMPLVNFIGAHDPRWLSTLDAIGRDLAFDALVRRYNIDDIDLDPEDNVCEGAFNACSFWYIACVARAGRTEEATLLFSKMTGYANHLGLYAEETGTDGRQLGNFPQAFSHLALIHAVVALNESDKPERTPTY